MNNIYKLPVIKEYEEILEKIKRENIKVAIFGFGLLGKFLLDILKDMGITVDFFCDNNKEKQGNQYKGIEIKSQEALYETNIPVIIGVYDYLNEITRQLEETKKIKTILPYYSCFQGQTISRQSFWENDWSIQDALWLERKKIFEKKDKAVLIERIEVAITEKCTLRCKHCANLVQYYEKPRHEEKSRMMLAVSRFLSAVDLVGSISYLGGEPLSNPDIGEYVEQALKQGNIVNVLVITNGTLLPDAKLIDQLKKDERCMISISDYGITSRRKDEIIELADSNEFKVAVSRRENVWREAGVIEYKELSKEELEAKLIKCKQKKFTTIKNGKLYKCPFIAHADSLGAIPKKDIDALDLTNLNLGLNELKEEIQKFIEKKCFNACKYCIENGKDNMIVPAAVQIKEPIYYDRHF